MAATYNRDLVLVSALIAVLAFYTAVNLAAMTIAPVVVLT